MALEAPRLNLTMRFLDPSSSSTSDDDDGCPASQVVGCSRCVPDGGSLYDETKLRQLASMGPCDVITMEIEHVGVDGLMNMERDGMNVQPSSRVVRIIQDKYAQKVRRPKGPFLTFYHKGEEGGLGAGRGG